MEESFKSKYGIHKKDIRFFDTNDNETNSFLTKLNNGTLAISNWQEFTQIIKNIYDEIKSFNEGNVADYIPQLANVNDELFSVCVVSVDGQVFELGDKSSIFSIQSCSKPITYGIALETYGEEFVHNFVGKEPSGRNFNDMCLNEDSLPHNPLINSGAIMTTSLIEKNLAQSERFEFASKFWNNLTPNTYFGFNNSIYLSEKDSADRNYCLAYMMQEKRTFINGKNKELSLKYKRKWNSSDLVKNLELYFQFCSLETNVLGAGLIASTLANGGINPWSNKKIFNYDTVKDILSIMLTCGMYDYSGEWGYKIGIPAKSGVSGLIYAVIPGICGISVYSPKLDKIGNSHRGILFFKKLSQYCNIHIFDSKNDTNKYNISKNNFDNKNVLGFLLLQACKTNNINTINEVLSKGCDVNFMDYDSRTGLHIAVCEKNKDSLTLLLKNNADINLKDRWGKTPLDEAISNTEILNILNNFK